MSDIASATLGRLNRLDNELHYLRLQFQLLAGYTSGVIPGMSAEHFDQDKAQELMAVALSATLLGSDDTKKILRDIASKLPTRGIDYGICSESTKER